MSNTPEPTPTPQPDAPASWDQVIAFVTAALPESPYRDAIVMEMRERNVIGTAKYGTTLTVGNGRNHLVDAYQEALDLTVYLRTELEERGIDPLTGPRKLFSTPAPGDIMIAGLFVSAVQTALVLKTMLMGGSISLDMIPGADA